MSLDRLELLEVRLGSGKVYLVPRALLENLVHALPVSALQLIVSASPGGGLLDPSGLPSEAGEGALEGLSSQQRENAKWAHVLGRRVTCHARKGGGEKIPSGVGSLGVPENGT